MCAVFNRTSSSRAYTKAKEETPTEIPQEKPKGIFQRAQHSKKQKELNPEKQTQTAYAPIKGLFKGFADLAEQAIPLAFEDEPLEERQKLQQLGHQYREDLEGDVEEHLPTEDTFLANTLERGGRLFPSLRAGPGGIGGVTARSVVGGLGGELVKELGGGETAQALGELGGVIGPDLGRRILGNRNQQELINMLRSRGLSEEQIAPLIQSERKMNWLSRGATRGRSTQNRLQESRRAAGNIYNELRNSPHGTQPLDNQNVNILGREMGQIWNGLSVQQQQMITPELQRLFQQGFTGGNLIRFNQAMNELYSQGNRFAGNFLRPVERALFRVNRQFGREFQLVNQAYRNNINLSRRLRPSIAHRLYDLGRWGAAAVGTMTGNFGLLAETVGEHAARRFMSELLTNPRLQNLGRKALQAANNGQFALVKKITDMMISNSEEDKEK